MQKDICYGENSIPLSVDGADAITNRCRLGQVSMSFPARNLFEGGDGTGLVTSQQESVLLLGFRISGLQIQVSGVEPFGSVTHYLNV